MRTTRSRRRIATRRAATKYAVLSLT